MVLSTRLAAHVWLKVLEGGVGVHLGGGFAARDYGTLGGQGQDRGREGGVLVRRGREGRKARRRRLEDGAVGADHWLNAGDPVNGPGEEKQTG